MNLNAIEFLTSQEGARWLEEIQAKGFDKENHVWWATRLRERLEPDFVSALLETADLRHRAKSKFSKADEMLFDREGLEMSSAEIVSQYRMQRYAQYERVADLGAGIGGDVIGLMGVGAGTLVDVVAVDRDAVRLAMCQHNAEAYYGKQCETVEADLANGFITECDAVFFDPMRRTERGKRIFRLGDYRPSLTILENWRGITENWGVKASPGIDLREVAALPDEVEVEFISVRGELREAVLWYGGLRSGAEKRATRIDGDVVMSMVGDDKPVVSISEPKGYILEPDPSVLRAGLVQDLAVRLGADMIDPTIAFMTSSEVSHPSTGSGFEWVRVFEVEDWMPFGIKRLRGYLRERDVGRVTIKVRGMGVGKPVDVEDVRRQLRLKGRGYGRSDEERVVILTRCLGKPIAIVGQALDLR